MMPDLFNGDNVPFNFDGASFDFPSWIKKHPSEEVTGIVENVLAQIKSEFSMCPVPHALNPLTHFLEPKKIAAVGYCFGAKYVVQLLAKPSIDSGFGAHPSFVTLEEVAAIKGPYSIAAARPSPLHSHCPQQLKNSNHPQQKPTPSSPRNCARRPRKS